MKEGIRWIKYSVGAAAMAGAAAFGKGEARDSQLQLSPPTPIRQEVPTLDRLAIYDQIIPIKKQPVEAVSELKEIDYQQILEEVEQLKTEGALRGFKEPISLDGLEQAVNSRNDLNILGTLGYLAIRTQTYSVPKNGQVPKRTEANRGLSRIGNRFYFQLERKYEGDSQKLEEIQAQKEQNNFEWRRGRLKQEPFTDWFRVFARFPKEQSKLKLAVMTGNEFRYALDIMESCIGASQSDLLKIKSELLPRMVRWAMDSDMTAVNKDNLGRAWDFFCEGRGQVQG